MDEVKRDDLRFPTENKEHVPFELTLTLDAVAGKSQRSGAGRPVSLADAPEGLRPALIE